MQPCVLIELTDERGVKRTWTAEQWRAHQRELTAMRAAAQDMLAALEDVVHAIDQMEAPFWPDFVDEMMEKARAAIAKARNHGPSADQE